MASGLGPTLVETPHPRSHVCGPLSGRWERQPTESARRHSAAALEEEYRRVRALEVLRTRVEVRLHSPLAIDAVIVGPRTVTGWRDGYAYR